MGPDKTRFSLIPEEQHGRSFAICKRQYFVKNFPKLSRLHVQKRVIYFLDLKICRVQLYVNPSIFLMQSRQCTLHFMSSLNNGCLIFLFIFFAIFILLVLSRILFCAFIKDQLRFLRFALLARTNQFCKVFFQLNDVDSRDLLSKFGFGDVSNPADLQRIYITEVEDAFREGRYTGKTNYLIFIDN